MLPVGGEARWRFADLFDIADRDNRPQHDVPKSQVGQRRLSGSH